MIKSLMVTTTRLELVSLFPSDEARDDYQWIGWLWRVPDSSSSSDRQNYRNPEWYKNPQPFCTQKRVLECLEKHLWQRVGKKELKRK